MRADEFSRFERAVFDFVLARTQCIELAMQLWSVRLVGREWTKCGYYTQLEVASDAPLVPLDVIPHRTIDGPTVTSAAIEFNTGGTILWFEDGRLAELEVWSGGNVFPEDHDDLDPFTLSLELLGD